MKTKMFAPAAVALLLAACGGGGSDSPAPAPAPSPVAQTPPATNPPAATPAPPAGDPNARPPAPAPLPPPTVVPVAPAPVTPPVEPPKPATPSAPPPPPPPAEGTYISGKVLLAALAEYSYDYDLHRAYPPAGTESPPFPESVVLSYFSDSFGFTHFTYAAFDSRYYETNFPSANLRWAANFNGGSYNLSQTLSYYGGDYNGETVLLRSADFPIKDDDKFILNQTFAEWKGMNGANWFVQLQVQDYRVPGQEASTASFNFCVHMNVPQVIRLSCTIHDRLTGKYRGVRIIDDSRGVGSTTYLPK